MHAPALTTQRSARAILGTLGVLGAVQLLLFAFAPSADARAIRWGGGYEVRGTMFGYIVYCEEPVERTAGTDGRVLWRTTIFKPYGANLVGALKERDRLNVNARLWAEASPSISLWWARRCMHVDDHVSTQRRLFGYTGVEVADNEMAYVLDKTSGPRGF